MAPAPPAPLPADVAEFLTSHTRAFLLTLRRDGSPTVHPMTGFFGDGRIVMNTYRKSAKARNVERDPRVACVVVDGYGHQDVRAVAVRGSGRVRSADGAELPSGPRAAPKVAGSIAGRVADRLASGKRVLVEVEPDEAAFVGGT